jgi:putative ubiquitin-RnfH superfamily antitoxin RatB of RatAB toxin-antitoxin module
MKVSIAYATPEKQTLFNIDVPEGSTVETALAACRSTSSCPMLKEAADFEDLTVGIFGKIIPLTTLLKEGDRIELYRPLPIDPKEARRKKSKG